MLLKRRFWKSSQKIEREISMYFSRVCVHDLGYDDMKIYGSQTKILEGGTKDVMRTFEGHEYSIWAKGH